MPGEADAGTAVDAWADFAERRPFTATPRGPRPLLDLFPPAEEHPTAADDQPLETPDLETPDLDTAPSPGRLAAFAGACLLLMAAGATAAAYVFRDELAAILAAWRQTP